jgi:hypothetical protein
MSTRTITLTVHGEKSVFFSDNDFGETVRIGSMIAQMGFFPFHSGGDVLFDYRTKQFCGLTFCFYQSYSEIQAWYESQNVNASLRYSLVDSPSKLKCDPIHTFATYAWPIDTFGHLDALFFDSEALDIAPTQLGLGEIYWWYSRETGQLVAISIPRFDEVLDNCCLSLFSPVDLVPLMAPEEGPKGGR